MHSPTPEKEGPPALREGSGTAWLPDDSPMYSVHWQRGAWQLVAHENLFVQFLQESGERGADQFGSINWMMGMAQRRVGPGLLQLRGMFSAEPGTISGCGYPDLLATGEHCDGAPIHDRQHQHDLLMEISGLYDAPLTRQTRWQVYAGLSGEPALGPVAYPHRLSAMPNPLAPISHHWLDATHITFGVITAGVYSTRVKIEASIFNGREPDEVRTNLDLGAPRLIVGARLVPADDKLVAASVGGQTDRRRGRRPTAMIGSISGASLARRPISVQRECACDSSTTVAWGRNAESHHASSAVLLESALTFDDRRYGVWQVRGRWQKRAQTSSCREPPEQFTVAKLQGGYTRYLKAWHRLQPGVGGTLSAGFVPASLKTTYGSRVNAGFGVFVTLRPTAMTRVLVALKRPR